MIKSSSLMQDHTGKFYVVQENTITGEVKNYYLPEVVQESIRASSMNKVDLRTVGGHVWNLVGKEYVADTCGHSGCSICYPQNTNNSVHHAIEETRQSA